MRLHHGGVAGHTPEGIPTSSPRADPVTLITLIRDSDALSFVPLPNAGD